MENKKTILVTGATGRQGGATVRHLLKNGFNVRALSRDPNKASALSLKKAGAEVIQGDMNNMSDMLSATENVYGVFSVQNYWEKGVGYKGEVLQGKLLADAAHKNEVQHFVQASVADAHKVKGLKHWECKNVVEKYIDQLQLPRTFLGETIFMDNIIDPKLGSKFLPYLSSIIKPDTPLHFIATEDVGGITAEIFKRPNEFIGKKIDLAGDVVTLPEFRERYEKIVGKKASTHKFPAWLIAILNGEGYRQLKWNNNVGWKFSAEKCREIYPELMNWDDFFKKHEVGQL